MEYKFAKHYTLAEARALLPEVRQWLVRLREHMQAFNQLEKRLASLSQDGSDLGGASVNDWVRQMQSVAELFAEFHRRDILIKDLERGLVDFPSLKGDREIFLCWEQDDDDIQFWHDLDSGYSGREPLE
jgi:hypothetical protein